MEHEDISRPTLKSRVGAALDRAEAIYLRVLRGAILLIATLLLGYSAWLAISSLYKISRSPDSVIEQSASVAADEITDAEMPSPEKVANSRGAPAVNAAHQAFYDDFTNRYYALFKSRFEPYRQKEDKQLTRDEFDDSFINSSARMNAIKAGDVRFEDERADLGTMLSVMTDASQEPRTTERLQRYKTAKKVTVKRKVQRTRIEYRSGWDSYSTNCDGWYYEPIGCRVQRAVQVPYTDTVTTTEFPKGTQSHTQIFRAFQDKYLSLLQERRDRNGAKAEEERQGIALGIVEGRLSLLTALYILGGFLILMFFFLLIAIERHQRKLSRSMALATSTV